MAQLVAENRTKGREVLIARELDEIDYWTRELNMEWERSKKPAEKSVDRTGGVDKDGHPKLGQHETRVEGQTGNPAYPSLIQSFMRRRAELLGLDALPAAQVKQADVEAAKGIMQLMRLADLESQAEVVTGPPLISHQEVAIAVQSVPVDDSEDEAAVVMTVPVGSTGESKGS